MDSFAVVSCRSKHQTPGREGVLQLRPGIFVAAVEHAALHNADTVIFGDEYAPRSASRCLFVSSTTSVTSKRRPEGRGALSSTYTVMSMDWADSRSGLLVSVTLPSSCRRLGACASLSVYQRRPSDRLPAEASQ